MEVCAKDLSGYDIDFMYHDPPKEYHAGWFIKDILARIINPNPQKEYHVGLCPVCGNTLEQIPDPLYQNGDYYNAGIQRRIAEQKGWWNYSYLKDFLFLY